MQVGILTRRDIFLPHLSVFFFRFFLRQAPITRDNRPSILLTPHRSDIHIRIRIRMLGAKMSRSHEAEGDHQFAEAMSEEMTRHTVFRPLGVRPHRAKGCVMMSSRR